MAATFDRSDPTSIGGVPVYAYGSLEAVLGTFDLLSFRFGCNVFSDERFGSGATGCTIAVIGFDRKGNQVPAANFTFAPTEREGVHLILAKLSAPYSVGPQPPQSQSQSIPRTGKRHTW